MLRVLALLLLLAPVAGLAGEGAATLRVSVQVRGSATVSVDAGDGAPTVLVKTAAGTWSSALADARDSAAAVRVEPSAEHPGYLVVTVLADVRN